MITFLDGPGFLGTFAGFRADLSLLLIVVTAILFTIGWRLAVRERFDSHRVTQNLAVCLNALIVLLAMLGIFIKSYLPAIPGNIDNRVIALITLHAVGGTLGLLYGIYVVLVADKILPTKLRFTNFKPIMRISYILYLLLTLGGIGLYLTLYV